MKHVPYREAIGSLMYAVIRTWLDIAYMVSYLARFMANSGHTLGGSEVCHKVSEGNKRCQVDPWERQHTQLKGTQLPEPLQDAGL